MFKPYSPFLSSSTLFPAVPYFIFLISLTSTVRGWPQLSTSERQLQLSLFLGILTTPVLAILFRPRLYLKWAAVANIIGRITIVTLPTSGHLISMLVNGDLRISQKWAASPVGALGPIIFASRTLVLFVSATTTHLPFWHTVLAQTLVLVASYRTAPDMCTAILAEAPWVVSALRAVHNVFSSVWIIIVRFPLPSAVPFQLVHPGTSLFAVTLSVMMLSYIFPMGSSAARAAVQYNNYEQIWEYSQQTREEGQPKRQAPLPAKMAFFVESLCDYPIHAAWVALCLLCLLWIACYTAADHICAASL